MSLKIGEPMAEPKQTETSVYFKINNESTISFNSKKGFRYKGGDSDSTEEPVEWDSWVDSIIIGEAIDPQIEEIKVFMRGCIALLNKYQEVNKRRK